MSAKRKRVEHTEEATDEDLSFWDALDQELQDLSKLSHTEKISQTYAEDLNQYNAPPEREILDAHRAFNNYFESILPQIIEAGNLARAGRQGY
ncbi:hypothetical protein BT69DRAFT_1327759 [Atractiella rhizophila]|nr:hypothetical protein BT69DRAFT_1327759 [Atractiella rhizophila]